ncbi:MAG: S8/S53 family peptidase [Myxococcota bacterium]
MRPIISSLPASLLFLWSALASGQFATPQPLPLPLELDGRACTPDVYFVDVPIGASAFPPGSPPAFEADLTGVAMGRVIPWFCEPGDGACAGALGGGVHARVESVFAASSAPFRSDGHLRHFRIYFVDASQRRLRVRTEASCEIVQQIRSMASLHLFGHAWPPTCVPHGGGNVSCTQTRTGELRVGRSCALRAMSRLVDSVGTARASWHLSTLGLGAPAGVPGSAPVRLALIDGGVRGQDQGALGVDQQWDLTDDFGGVSVDAFGSPTEPSSTEHLHGTAMAALFRQVDPQAAIDAYMVLGHGEQADLGAVARAVDQALLRHPHEPVIINLSLGMRHEYTYPAELERQTEPGLSCLTDEDGADEALRYALWVARNQDRIGHRSAVVVAAAGNQVQYPTRPGYPHNYGSPYAVDLNWTFSTNAALKPSTPCGRVQPMVPELFVPAEFGNSMSCTGAGTELATVLAAGAVDALDRPSVLSPVDREPPIVAPGQHVFIEHPHLDKQEPGLACTTDVGSGEHFEFPQMLTGSSVASVLVAGVLSRGQSLHESLYGSSMDWPSLQRLAYLTGEAVCRTTQGGIAVRRIQSARLEQALSSCPGLVTCAQSLTHQDPAVIDSSTLGSCAAELVVCGLETHPLHPSCIVGDPSALSPDVGEVDRLIECNTTNPSACSPEELVCSGYSEVATNFTQAPSALDGSSAGVLGPQPTIPLCPHCGVHLATHGGLGAMLELNFNDQLSAQTQFRDPVLVLTDTSGQPVDLIRLDSHSDPSTWIPGHTIMVGIDHYPWWQQPLSYQNHQLRLDATIVETATTSLRLSSPMFIGGP